MLIHTYDSIISIENLLLTWERFLRGKRHRKDVMNFQGGLAENITLLQRELVTRAYTHGGYSAFNISDPKPRNIHKASVRDRLLHHLIYKELYAYFHERFIYDSYSCRPDKGTHRALDRFQTFAQKVSKNNTRTCHVLKCDVRKFFASIDHTTLHHILARHIADAELRDLLDGIVSSFSSAAEGKGLPLGNLTSQLLVNVYMHEFDMYMKQTLRVKYYIRYADDFVIFSEDKSYLEGVLLFIDAFLSEKLKLTLHPEKVYIKTYASGVDFLGWVQFPYHRQIRTTTKRKVLRKLRGFPKRETVSSYRGLLSHGNTHVLAKSLEL